MASGTRLEDISGTSPSDIWAVGDDGFRPIIEHFDGERWGVVPSPRVRASLSGVRAFALDDAWAVGRHGILPESFVEHWDGTAWNVVEVPQPGKDSSLLAIDGTSQSDIWAVGKYTTDEGINGLAQHFDGTTWTVVPMDDVSPLANVMQSVEAIAPDDVWAVGYQEIEPFEVIQPLAQHWDGTAWTAVPIELPPPDNANSFEDVSASSSTDVWAVGKYGDSLALMEHWDGTAWKRYPALGHVAWGVATISPTDAWAGGSGASPDSWHWDGAAWSRARTPRVGPTAGIADLLALSEQNIWAVGTYNPPQGGGLRPLILRSKGVCG